MKKESLQIVLGVSAVALIGAGVLLFARSRNKTVSENVLDKLSEHNRAEVMKLHPNARKKFADLILKIESKGYRVLITSGYRDFDKQAKLHAENPSNAKAGYSNHNYGYAIDINVYDPKTGKQLLKKATSKSLWESSGIVKIAKDMGFEWGGDFNNYHDPIHFYIPREKSTSQMKALVDAGKVDKSGYVLAFSGQPTFELNMPDEWAA